MSKIRLVNFAFFHDAENKLILGGIRGVFFYDFNYKGKYDPKLAASIDQDGKHISVELENKKPLDDIEELCQWVLGLKVDVKNEIVVSWNKASLCFHHLSGEKAGKLMFVLKDLTAPGVEITDLHINMDYRYFYNSTSRGQICVWKLDGSKKLIHSFAGHFKEVSCLQPLKNSPDQFLSASLDGTIRIWSLDKFQQLYCL